MLAVCDVRKCRQVALQEAAPEETEDAPEQEVVEEALDGIRLGSSCAGPRWRPVEMGTAGHRTARSNRSGATVLAHRKVKLQDTAAMQQVQENTAEDCHSVAHDLAGSACLLAGCGGCREGDGSGRGANVKSACSW